MAKRRNGMFGFLTEKKVTYKRSVGKERIRLQKEARKEARKRELAEIKSAELVERKRKAERKKADDIDRKIEREWREKGLRNPPVSRLKKGVRGVVRLVGRGENRRLIIIT